MRHPPLGGDENDGYIGEIPGHRNLHNQSVNSQQINLGGTPDDVLFDTDTGSRICEDIAALDYDSISNLQLPNPNTQFLDRDGNLQNRDSYHFKAEHHPTPCMFPHCEIRCYRNGERLGKNVTSPSMRTVIRRAFAAIAEKNRRARVLR